MARNHRAGRTQSASSDGALWIRTGQSLRVGQTLSANMGQRHFGVRSLRAALDRSQRVDQVVNARQRYRDGPVPERQLPEACGELQIAHLETRRIHSNCRNGVPIRSQSEEAPASRFIDRLASLQMVKAGSKICLSPRPTQRIRPANQSLAASP